MGGQQLVCPSCARAHPPEERFCADCGMPLVHAGGPQLPMAEPARDERPPRADLDG